MAAIGTLVAAVAIAAVVAAVGAQGGPRAVGEQQQAPSKRFSMNYLDLVSPTGAAKAASGSASASSRRSAGTKRFSMNFLDTMRDEADPRSWQRMGNKHTAAARSAAAALQTKRTLLAWSNADKSNSDNDEEEDVEEDEVEERHETKAKAKAALSARFLIETVNWLLLDAAKEGGVGSVCASPVMRKLVAIRRNLVLRHGDAAGRGDDLGRLFDC